MTPLTIPCCLAYVKLLFSMWRMHARTGGHVMKTSVTHIDI